VLGRYLPLPVRSQGPTPRPARPARWAATSARCSGMSYCRYAWSYTYVYVSGATSLNDALRPACEPRLLPESYELNGNGAVVKVDREFFIALCGSGAFAARPRDIDLTKCGRNTLTALMRRNPSLASDAAAPFLHHFWGLPREAGTVCPSPVARPRHGRVAVSSTAGAGGCC